MMNFVLVLAEENPVLPGGTWTEYEAEVSDDKLICKQKKDPAVTVEIPYASFQSAEFGIGSGNLWLQCELDRGRLVFCSPRKSWKSEAGKKLIEKIGGEIEIQDMKAYRQYTGPFFFLAMFK